MSIRDLVANNSEKYASASDFIEFGKRTGIPEKKIGGTIETVLEHQIRVETLISRSFPDDAFKNAYLLHYNTRRNLLTA